ncbi:MAG TPA: hypothetical protein VD788_05585 [Candidatus Polarisedimenticolaceae bacterium]|nr:hypothetical protein [Candidatus Polarisedimenticolaceae bacterium]
MSRIVRNTWIARAVLLASLGATAPARGAEIMIQASEDSWIDGLASTATHGAELALGICPVANYWMYFKFDLSPVGGAVDAAELRLTRIDGDRPEEISLYLITDDGWSETTLNGPGRPAPTDPPNASALAQGEVDAGYDRWTSAALAATVEVERTGDGTLSLMARENPAQMFDIRHYRSTESGFPAPQLPQLVVSCSTGEVASFVATSTDPATFTWSSGTAWDLIGGTLADLRADLGVSSAGCLADALPEPTFTDTRPDPGAGELFYYVVRGDGPCGTGSYGFASGGAERVPAADCP